MAIESILWDWQSEDDPIDAGCPECCGAGVVWYEGDASETTCPLCEGAGEYAEWWYALLNLPASALEAYAGAACDADAESGLYLQGA